MSQENIEKLLIKGAEVPNTVNLNAVYKAFEQNPDSVKDNKDALNLLFESFDPDALNITIANFIMAVCAFPVENSPKLRLLLTSSIKLVLPPYLDRPAVLKALGLRDANLPPSNIIGRYRKLNVLKNGMIVFLNSSSRWGSVGNIDTAAGTVVVNQFGAGARSGNVPLDLLLVTGVLFNSGIEILKISDSSGRTKMSSADFRAFAAKKAVTPLTESHLQQMAHSGVAAKMTPEEFEKWWNDTANSVTAAGERRSCDGRSLHEMTNLLDKEDAEKVFTDDEIAGFVKFFTNIREEVINNDIKRLAEVLVKISARCKEEQLDLILHCIAKKCAFWPADPMHASWEDLSVWSELAAKDIAVIGKLTKRMFNSYYIACLAMRLPQKALPGVASLADVDELDELIVEQHFCSADLSAWIWKNRKKGAEALTRHLNIDNIIRALSQVGLHKAWTPGLRELRNLLMDNSEFQKFVVSLADDPGKLTSSLQTAFFLSSGERQSLMVKLAASSKALKTHLEQGAGAKILAAGMSEQEIKRNNAMQSENEPSYTSLQSHRRLVQELDDIIKIHQPENREALKAARAHGDFRENAEFDAAKERRNFLSRRRGELEQELQFVQTIDMRKVSVSDIAVIGSKVTLKYADVNTEVYSLLGAWDGNPEKNYLSYKTRLGQVIYNQKKGAELELPNGKKAVLADVAVLDEAVLADMD